MSTAPDVLQAISLHDLFAGMAMIGLLAKSLHSNECGNSHVQHASVRDLPNWTVAPKAYDLADAMLTEKAKRNKKP